MNLIQLKWLWKFSDGYRYLILFTTLLSCVGVVCSLFFVELTKVFLDRAVSHESLKMSIVVCSLIGFKTTQLLCEQYETYLRTITRSKLEILLEYKMFCSLNESKVYGTRFHTGDSVYRLSGDVGIVAEGLAFTLPLLIYSIVQLIATWTYLMTMQPFLTIVIGSISPIIIIATYYYTKLLIPVSFNIREAGSKVNQYIQEHLQFHELIVSLGQIKFVQDNVSKLQSNFFQLLRKRIRLNIGADTITEFGFAAGYLCVFIWGIDGIVKKSISYGEFIVFIQLVSQLQRPVFLVKDQYPSFVSSLASVKRLMEIANLPKDDIAPDANLGSRIGLRFFNVSFRYSLDRKLVLKDFNYNFCPGSVTAIVGETGAGKSTIIKLALGLIYPSNGKILFYKQSGETKMANNATRCNCIYVPQGNNLLSGTIRYNLQLGNPMATDKEMKQALYTAAADFVFDELPDGIDTIVGERGFSLSEGQSQRIAIARGLLRKGSIVLLDEPTSALDNQTENTFLYRIITSNAKKTIIIVTHKDISSHIPHTIRIYNNNI
ncbi:MAG: ABC transporter ATP-binding protein/permease [Bacteroidales bacterium]|nr:ABC transporter ATP-binding protein/permease [Bacteroidales bacterium]MCM1146468.1 ABC transporter ATP-binding protein/permease [Bacteroidales bacterium]MCM1205094.1 ABC transporter ATP-binding protein/permease [Bacillota bacterium]MCM1509340.1 ABC transporter ATP-binding protein/permease [Clostridium sp.]